MKARDRKADLRQAELMLSYLLRYGVIACGILIAVGVALSWARPASFDGLGPLLSGQMVDAAAPPRALHEFAARLGAHEPAAVIALGLLLLIALPIARVASTVVLFLLERDALYFAITLFVFAVLVSGLVLGRAL